MSSKLDYLLKYEKFANIGIASADKQIARQKKILAPATGEEVLEIMNIIRDISIVIKKLVQETRDEHE